MKKTILLALIGLSSVLKAQDSTALKIKDGPAPKFFSHEIGFNTVLLIKQLFSNNPSAQLSQLPYQVGYTLGFKSKYGMRIGLGFDQSTQNTSIQGQNEPRTTKVVNGSYRLDLCKTLINYKKISCNGFFGGIADNTTIQTTTVDDQTAFGGSLIKTELTDKSTSYGAEIGLGLKYSFNKHIAVATEVPLQVKYTISSELDKQTVTNSFSSTFTQTITNTNGMSTKIYLPTSLFIIIMF